MTDIRGVDLNLLIVLDALLEERSVTRAASRLGYTQSTTSGMLARLRDLFGDPLFVRAQRGILPTPRAQSLAVPLRQLLTEGRRLIAPEAFDPATAEMTFAISANDYMQQALMVPFIKDLRREAPKLRLTIKPPTVAGLADALAQGALDLALTIPQFAMSDLPSRLLYREHYVAAVRRGHPLAERSRMTIDEFCNYDHVLVSPTGGSFEGPADEGLARIERRRSVRYSVPSFLIVPELLQAADLIAVIPSRLVRSQDKRLKLFKTPIDVAPFDVIAVWHQRTAKDGAHRWLRTRMAKMARPA
jgi:DNA-binding transcriptional LysR family regulator